MARSTRLILIGIGAVVALLLIFAVCLPLFLHVDDFRGRIEATLTKSLGRTVSIGRLDLSVWSAGLVATHATVADDPAFSQQPFIQADSVKIGVEIIPLILRKQLHIRSISLVSPKVQLLRAANGAWNYSTIGKDSGTISPQDAVPAEILPNLTVGHVTVENGRFTVGNRPAAGTTSRVYDQVNLEVKNFGLHNAFALTASAHLPGNGTVSVDGTAGPIDEQDASATPFAGHLQMQHIDPLAVGLVDASAGIRGLLDSMVLDANWNGQQMHVSKLLVENAHLTVGRGTAPPAEKPAEATPEGAAMLESLIVDYAEIKNGSVTVTPPGRSVPVVYQQLNAQISQVSGKTSSSFTVSAVLPGGGSLSAHGKAGPFNRLYDASTPIHAQLTLKQVDLASASVLPADAAIGGVADFQAQIQSIGQTLGVTGTGQIAKLRLAKNGQPCSKPVQVEFAFNEDEEALIGQVLHANFTIGHAVIQVNGSYRTAGASTALDLKVNGDSLPIDDLAPFLPAAGVRLPQGSQLQGGTLTTTLTVSGSTASPILSGPVHLSNTLLAGFNLGAKLHTLSQLTGGKIRSATGSGTNIRSLSMDIRESDGSVQTDNLALDVAGVGTATGSGTVSEAGSLHYDVVLKLTGLAGGSSAQGAGGRGGFLGGLAGLIPGGAAGLDRIADAALKNGIPVAIGGTTSNPTFAPNLAGLAESAGKDLLKVKPNGSKRDSLSNALGGLFGRH